MSGYTLTISIGRNVPNKRVISVKDGVTTTFDRERGVWYLSENDWLDFQIGVESIFPSGMANTRALGDSIWDGDVEETAIFQFFDAPKLTDEQVKQLRNLALEYGQDAIAVTYAKPTFVYTIPRV